MSETSAIYEPMRQMGWIKQQPRVQDVNPPLGGPIPASWRDTLIDRSLASGINIRVERGGFTIYGFSGWPPGVTRPHGTPGIRTLGEASESAKPVLISRLRLINSHLTLLHAAARFEQKDSPPVTRVHYADLYHEDYPDEGGPVVWIRPMEGFLPTIVTMADQRRIGVVKAKTFDTSLDWLEVVIARDMLIEFDLLNQTLSALATHDHALAVAAGWTICELRVRAMALEKLGGFKAKKVAQVCGSLRKAGLLSQALTGRLNKLRECRDKWLHNGVEPPEAVASEAARLSTELLQSVVPDLTTAAEPRLLIL